MTETETPAWALKGRDGEPVTLLQKLEQAMEFGSAMERLAIENNALYHAAAQREAALREALETTAQAWHEQTHDGEEFRTCQSNRCKKNSEALAAVTPQQESET